MIVNSFMSKEYLKVLEFYADLPIKTTRQSAAVRNAVCIFLADCNAQILAWALGTISPA
jgi:hypothetical protein